MQDHLQLRIRFDEVDLKSRFVSSIIFVKPDEWCVFPMMKSCDCACHQCMF